MAKRFLLTSTSAIKKEALQSFLREDDTLECCAVDPESPAGQWNAEQPVGDHGLICAKLRITSVPKERRATFDYVVSIENSIRRYITTDCRVQMHHEDVVNVVVLDVKRNVYRATVGGATPFAKKYWDEVEKYPVPSGFSYTVGEAMVADPECAATDPKNWMKDVANQDRTQQITSVLSEVFRQMVTTGDLTSLRAAVHYVPNHPKPGVLFQDIGPLLRNPEAVLSRLTAHCVLEEIGPMDVDCIVGLDARGFVIGGMLAAKWSRPFVMARKPGKLPQPKVSVDYGLEYGKNTLEMSTDAFDGLASRRVLIVDDLVATGGSMLAAIELVGKTDSPPKVVGCAAVLSVDQFRFETMKKLEAAGVPKLITLL